jgi:murein DD-endopeptidase MepM/ murein hydrolase activator NlpD
MARIVAALVAMALTVAAAPAAADDGAPGREVERLLIRLTGQVEEELDAALEEVPLPPEARTARLTARIGVLSRMIFAARFEALAALEGLVPGIAGLDRPGGVDGVPGIAMSLGDAADIVDLEAVVADWLRLEEALDRLAAERDLLAAEAGITMPERVCPVSGRVGFADDWGEDRGWGRGHKGTDAHADAGTPVVAVEAGAIVQTGWHWAGGVQIYLRGAASGDVYYYAHMDWWAPGIEPGTRVAAGDLVGWVGMSGNADTPHLHFGWMPAAREVDLDSLQNPYWLLRELCG